MILANIVVEMISDMVIKVVIPDCLVHQAFWKTKNQYIILFVPNVVQFCSHG